MSSRKEKIQSLATEINRLAKIAAISQKENKEIDFKESFDPSSTSEWSQIVKDIVAMANSGGGVIMFGIDDDSNIVQNFNKQPILQIDPATVVDKISAYTNEDFSDFEIVEIHRGGQSIPSFVIGPAITPIAFTRHGADISQGGKQRPAFAKGSVYFRHGAKSEPGNTNDLRRAIERVVNKKKKSWFDGVRKISNIKEGDEIIISKSKGDHTQKVLQPVLGKIVSDQEAQSFRPDNAAEIWPHRSKELVAKVNQSLQGSQRISSHDLQCIKKLFALDESQNPDLIYKPYKEVSPRYSDQFVSWIVEVIKKDSKVLEKARTFYRDQKGSNKR